MIAFIKIFDEVSGQTRYINPEYITDLMLYQYRGEEKMSIHVQSAHGGTGAGGIQFTVKGEECKKILYFAEKHTRRHGPPFKHPEGD
jgi:hypothetical protein